MMRLGDRMRGVPPECWALLLFLLPVAVTALLRIDLINHHPGLLRGPNDPDPWLRLTLVREWLQGGGWFNHGVAGTNAPIGGIATPWTRPLDGVIAALVYLQPDHAPLSSKLLRAAAALPLIWISMLLLALLHGARQLNAALVTPYIVALLLAATPVLWAYFGPGNADHHAPLCALWAWIVASSLKPRPGATDEWTQGLLMALMLWISPEALLPIAIIYGWHGMRWIIDGGSTQSLVTLTRAVACGTLVALLAERAPGLWLQPVYDSLSIVHVALMACCAVAAGVLACMPFTIGRAQRTIAALLTSVVLIAAMFLLYPKFFHGPMVDAAAFIFSDFLPRINEAKPLFSKPLLFIAALLFMPLLAITAMAYLLHVRDPAMAKPVACQLLYLLLATLAMACSQLRWYYYLFPITVMALAPIVATLFTPGPRWPSRLLRDWPEWRQATVRLLIIAVLVASPLMLLRIDPDRSTAASRRITACEASGRALIHSGALARALGNAPIILLAPTNLGAEILFYTPYRIVASNYHREAEGIRFVWDSMRIADETALRAHLAQRQIDAMLLCPDGYASKHAVFTHWLAGEKIPAWAVRIPLGNSRAPLLVRIKDRPPFTVNR